MEFFKSKNSESYDKILDSNKKIYRKIFKNKF